MNKTTLHLIPHTHWDREWYLPFQDFRFKLVQLIDKLLGIMESDPGFCCFMLDGQTVVLEDYLQIRPDQQERLEDLVKERRLSIGPWYILPDEFLVSPEALLRNLLLGKKISEDFGGRMMIGYIPDPFGHIAQMPQILNGFGIQDACFRRGLADEPVELWWRAPDGSKVLTSYLRDGYDNAAALPFLKQEEFDAAIDQIVGSLRPHSCCNSLLLMHGTDHQQPDERLVERVRDFGNPSKGYELKISSLPTYFAELHEKLKERNDDLFMVDGELRECKRHELLPGVLSSRVWIKQRNQECENLLERWAEPFSAIAYWLARMEKDRNRTTCALSRFTREAWRILLQCHPHDSICGCSIDQVHEEMRSRFDQVEQIANNIVQKSLEDLASRVNTESPFPGVEKAIVVFNASPFPADGELELEVPLTVVGNRIYMFDQGGKRIPVEFMVDPPQVLADLTFTRAELEESLVMIADGNISGSPIVDAWCGRSQEAVDIEVVLGKAEVVNTFAIEHTLKSLKEYLQDDVIDKFHILVRFLQKGKVRIYAKEVPPLGYKTYWMKVEKGNIPEKRKEQPHQNWVENGLLKVVVDEKDGTFILIDKRNKEEYPGLNLYSDEADGGDEYNFSPLSADVPILPEYVSCEIIQHQEKQIMRIVSRMGIPSGLAENRMSRAKNRILHDIVTYITVHAHMPRIDIKVEMDNRSQDHRFRVAFPTGINSDTYVTDSHFFTQIRKLFQPMESSGWMEQPRPEVPQRLFSFIKNATHGILLVNKGLPEICVTSSKNGELVFYLTLLRCTGWLSRDDLSGRPRAAGPVLATPGAQQLGRHVFEYALIPFGSDWKDTLAQIYAFDLPLKAVLSGPHSSILPPQGSFLKCDPTDFIQSTLKTAEDGKSVILRGYNLSGQSVPAVIFTDLPFSKYAQAQLDETAKSATLPIKSGRFTSYVAPYQIVTFRLS
jgi:alpha-mannosidase